MATPRTLFIKTAEGTRPESALVTSENAAAPPAISQPITLGDKRTVKLYFVDGAGGFDSIAGSTIRYAIGVPGLGPTGGTFWLGFGSATSGLLTSGKRYQIQTFVAGDVFTNVGAASNATGVVFTATGTTPTTWTNGSTLIEITTDLSYAIAAADLQTALNALASIAAAGNVAVSGTAPNWLVQFNNVGSRATMAGDGTGLLPDGQCYVSEIQSGTTTVRERQHVRLLRKPFVLQDTWTADGNGWTAVVNYGTHGLADYLGSLATRTDGPLVEEIEVTNGSGEPQTFCSVQIVARNETVNPQSFVPDPIADYYTKAETDAAIAAITAGNYEDYEALSFSVAGNTNVSPIANFTNHTAIVTAGAGAGAYTRTLSILATNATDGKFVRIKVAMPASGNPTVEIRNDSAGGTLLATASPKLTAYNVIYELVFDGAAWVLFRTDYETALIL